MHYLSSNIIFANAIIVIAQLSACLAMHFFHIVVRMRIEQPFPMMNIINGGAHAIIMWIFKNFYFTGGRALFPRGARGRG